MKENVETMKDNLSNQRLIELIGEIDAITLKVNPSMGNDGYTSVSLRVLGEDIEVLRDQGSRATASTEVSRADIAKALLKHTLRGLR